MYIVHSVICCCRYTGPFEASALFVTSIVVVSFVLGSSCQSRSGPFHRRLLYSQENRIGSQVLSSSLTWPDTFVEYPMYVQEWS